MVICLIDHFSPALCIIILGQLMSLCLGGTAVSSQVLANNGFNAPTGTAFCLLFTTTTTIDFLFGLFAEF